MKYPQVNATNSEERFNVKWRIDVTDFGKSQTYAVYTWFRTILVHVVPLFLLCVINFYLIKFIRIANSRWRRTHANRRSSRLQVDVQSNHRQSTHIEASSRRSERRQAAQRKLTVLLIAIVCIFLAGQIPQAFAYVSNFQIFLRLFGRSSQSLLCCPPYRLYRGITNCICLITYSANFFLYATLNYHFKNQLKRWFGLCVRRSTWRHPDNQRTDMMDSERHGTAGINNQELIRKEALSADACLLKLKQPPKEAVLDFNSVTVPVTDPNSRFRLSNQPNSYSYYDHVWRVSIAVLPKAGGRPVALANAMMRRSVTISESPSTSYNEVAKPSQTTFSGLPRNSTSNSSELVLRNSPEKKVKAAFTTQTLIQQTGRDLFTSPNEKIVVRMDSHSKRFWSKRRQLLAETKKRVKYKKTRRAFERQTTRENNFQLQVTSLRFQAPSYLYGDRCNLHFLLPACLSNMSWCPPFVLASMLRANRSLKGAPNRSLRNAMPTAYKETNLDYIL